MGLTTDTKVIIGILLATVAIIAGAAFFASRTNQPGTADVSQAVTVEDPDLLYRPSNKNTAGPQDAQVTVVEFGDFECPACASLAVVLKEVKQKFADKPVRFEYRHFPLRQHPNARPAAIASEAAADQDKFWEYHDVLYENQNKLTRDNLIVYATELGLTMDTFRAALESAELAERVDKDQADGQALRLTATPALFINNQQYAGAWSVAAISEAIDKALQ